MSVINVSFIVCSFNGAHTIERALDSLVNQDTFLKTEIIFVDNNSQDNTREIVNHWHSNNNSNILSILEEPHRGKVNALKKAIDYSKGEVIIICDDDNFLSPKYAENAYDLITKNPSIGLACGINNPVYSVIPPDWFEDYKILFGCGQISSVSGDVTDKKSIWGAGMVCRGDLLRKIYTSGIRHLTSGSFSRSGFRVGGEDNELCFWIIHLGYKLWFSTDLILDHFMLESRLNKDYLEKLTAGIIAGNSFLGKNLDIIKRAMRPIWKRDIFYLFMPGVNGKVARIKFRIQPRNDIHYVNVRVLKKLKKELQYEKK